MRAGRLSLLLGDGERLPPFLGPFDAIFSSNVWMFWTDQTAAIRGLSEHLRPGGRLAVSHMPPARSPDPAAAQVAAANLQAQFADAGLASVQTTHDVFDGAPCACVIGTAAR